MGNRQHQARYDRAVKGDETVKLSCYPMTATTALAGVIAAASLMLSGPLHAQQKSTSARPSMGMSGQGMGMTGMMGPMKMTGAVTMDGKPYDMRCSMTPMGKPKGMMGGKMGMGGMTMDQPIKMSGTMTMMGQKYRCEMVMTPARKQSNR
jgi:hypothetical protein